VNPETRNWLAGAEYDLETAGHMLATGRCIYVVFMCHLAVEKVLKALVCEATNASPPRTHDLDRLLGMTSAALEPPLAQFVTQLSQASVTTRYPDDLARMVSQYPAAVAQTYLERTREVIACLKADPRLQPSSPAT